MLVIEFRVKLGFFYIGIELFFKRLIHQEMKLFVTCGNCALALALQGSCIGTLANHRQLEI